MDLCNREVGLRVEIPNVVKSDYPILTFSSVSTVTFPSVVRMSYSAIRSHEEKARNHEKNSEKALEVNYLKMKFKADYFLAATEMTEAANSYQLAKIETSARACFIKAAELRLKDHDHQSAARLYESALNFDKAAECYLICGGVDSAVRTIMKKAKLHPELELECFESAIDLYSKDERKEILASDIFKQYIPRLITSSDYEKYFTVSNRYMELLVKLEQYPFAHKEILSQVVVNLYQNQIVGAERVLSGPNLNVPGFVHSQEYAAADDMIQAIRENDGDQLKQIVSKPAVTYLNIEIVKLARSIKTLEHSARPDLQPATSVVEATSPPHLDTLLM